jgi:hypothetical protein
LQLLHVPELATLYLPAAQSAQDVVEIENFPATQIEQIELFVEGAIRPEAQLVHTVDLDDAANVPALQDTQDVYPESEYEPGGQLLHEAEPAIEVLVPPAQAMQTLSEEAAITVEDFPARQLVQLTDPGVKEYLPAEQAVHSEEDLGDMYPALQSIQTAADVAATVEEAFPAGQLLHDDAPVGEYLPSTQPEHAIHPASAYVPGRQHMTAAVTPLDFAASQEVQTEAPPVEDKYFPGL